MLGLDQTCPLGALRAPTKIICNSDQRRGKNNRRGQQKQNSQRYISHSQPIPVRRDKSTRNQVSIFQIDSPIIPEFPSKHNSATLGPFFNRKPAQAGSKRYYVLRLGPVRQNRLRHGLTRANAVFRPQRAKRTQRNIEDPDPSGIINQLSLINWIGRDALFAGLH